MAGKRNEASRLSMLIALCGCQERVPDAPIFQFAQSDFEMESQCAGVIPGAIRNSERTAARLMLQNDNIN